MNKLFCSILIFVFASIPLLAQQNTKPVPTSPVKAITDLKNGVLIVRLTSEYRKLEALEELLENGDISVETEANLPLKMTRIEVERDLENDLWVRNFKAHYQFSDILFAYDTLRMDALIKNDGKNCFLDEDMKINPSLSLNGRPFLMLYKGIISEGSGAEAVLFRDANFVQLKKPFPYFVRTTRFMYVFNSIFKGSIADARNIEQVVKKIEKKLNKFYNTWVN